MSPTSVAYTPREQFALINFKADNIVIHGDKMFAKSIIIDFGKAQYLSKVKKRKGLSGEQLEKFLKRHSHIAPEVAKGIRTEGVESDVFSFGVMISSAGKVMKCASLAAKGGSCANPQWEVRPGISAMVEDLCCLRIS